MSHVNYDTGTIAALAAPLEGTNPWSIVAAQGPRRAMMSMTALNESLNQITKYATPGQRAAAIASLANVLIIPDMPSERVRAMRYPDTPQSPGNPGKMANFENDKIIFGTGDRWGATTFTSDKVFLRQALDQGIVLNAWVHGQGRFGVH